MCLLSCAFYYASTKLHIISVIRYYLTKFEKECIFFVTFGVTKVENFRQISEQPRNR